MTDISDHTYEVTAGWTIVYAQPTTFSKNQRRVTRGMRMRGRAAKAVRGAKAWVELAQGGYVLASRLRLVDMNDAAWLAFIDTLTPGQRYLVQGIMARVQTILNSDRILEIEDVQHLEDNDANQQRHIEADDTRMDMLEADANADNVRIGDMERAARRQRTEEDVREQHMEQIDETMQGLSDRVTDLEHPHERASGER